MSPPSDDEPVPKLPRGRGIKLSGPEMVRILFLGAMLVAIIVMTRPCANAVSGFVMSFDTGSGAGSAGSAAHRAPATGKGQGKAAEPDPSQFVRLRPGMTDEQVKAAIEEAKAKAAARAAAAAGSGAAGSGAEGSGAEGRGAAGSGAEGSGGMGSGAAGSGR